ncbi:hypothetical protein [uncultured Tenacibaculum sp.]|uniref:hypothetical protein n=1 Tax=uncultured Tenacibaculum sp. TaxID=174713 RepID=UPI00262D9D03|nr:hypothetical protein [uncultured Tenacibaculum sp.]
MREELLPIDSFDYFKSEKQFQKNYERFKLEGILLENEKYKAYFQRPGNQYYDENGKEEIVYPEEVVVDFFNEYLPNKIKRICYGYEMEMRGLCHKYSGNPQALYYNCNSLINFLETEKNFFENNDFIKRYDEIRKVLLFEIDKTIRNILPNEYLQFSNDFEKNKIKFNLSKTEICFLFS